MADKGSALLKTHDLIFLAEGLLDELGQPAELVPLLQRMNDFAVQIRYYLEVPDEPTVLLRSTCVA